jgi:hypothetical protein
MTQVFHRRSATRFAAGWVAAFTAAATALTSLPAFAQDGEAPPTCPQGYTWDEASGRCQRPRAGSYATPLQQMTQATYVPQSVAMSGPATLKDWHPGDPVPDGYHTAEKPRTGLIVGGAVTFGVLYLVSVMGAAIIHDANNNSYGGNHDNADALFVPGIGPFLQMGKTTTATGNVVNVIDGVAQCGGLAMLYIGLTSPRTVAVRNDLGMPRLLPTPYIARDGGGLGLVGHF